MSRLGILFSLSFCFLLIGLNGCDSSSATNTPPSSDEDTGYSDGDSDWTPIVTACTTDLDCQDSYYCDDGQCREADCFEDTDCTTGYFCQDHICLPESPVTTDGDDEIEQPSPDGDQEIEISDGDTELPPADSDLQPDGDQEPDIPQVSCNPGEKACLGNGIITCNATGDAWSDPVDCSQGQSCIVDTCITQVCEPGVYGECVSEIMIYQCNSHGTGLEEVLCSEHTYCEANQGCLAIECDPNAELECVDENTVKKCTPEGNDWYTEECPEDTICRGTGCVEIICEAGDWQCEDDVLFYCNALGTDWDEIMDCTESDSVCTEGACMAQICEPGVLACDETDAQLVKQCNESGTTWEESETCLGTDECRDGECMSLCEMAAFDKSYVGCDYWPVDLYNESRAEGDEGEFAVVVSNPQTFPVNASISNQSGQLQSKTIQPGAVEVFLLGSANHITAAGISAKAYHLHSDAPIIASQMNPYGDVLIYSNDASLLLPEGAMGSDYIGLTWPTHRSEICECTFWLITCIGGYDCDERWDTPGYLSIAATKPGTTTVTVKYSTASRSGSGVSAETAGATRSYTLNQFEVLSLQSAKTNCPDVDDDTYTFCANNDLTGSVIEASQPIAVYGGHGCTFIPENLYACDHMEHQLFPVETWGENYCAVRTEPRSQESDYYKIVASEADTRVTITPDPTGQSPRTLGIGEKWEFNTRNDFTIAAEKPIMVGHFLAGQDATGLEFANDCNYDSDCAEGYTCCYECGYVCTPEAGDPAMMLLAPNEQFRKEYIFLVPPNYKYDNATIIAPLDTQITLDDVMTLDSNTFTAVSGEYRRHRMSLADGPHHLVATKPVGVYLYGYSAFVSYAYTGGLDLKTINPKP